MSELYAEIQASAEALRARGAPRPDVAVILGSGLAGLEERLEDRLTLPMAGLPHFAPSTVDFHAGALHFGRLGGVTAAVLEGRLHYYEGHSMRQVVQPLRALAALGARSLVVTSAVGGLNPDLAKGDIVAVRDHINLMGDNPLIGPNDERLGPRFPDMSAPYDPDYRRRAAAIAAELGGRLEESVLVAVAGPNLETAAEYRFLREIGADVVGMSLVPENIAAVHAGLRVLGLSVVTDLCDPDALEPVDVPAILRVAAEAGPRLQELVARFLETLNPDEGLEHE